MYTSTRSNHAIRIVIDMMRHREPSTVTEIAQRQELPEIYTRKLLIRLAQKKVAQKIGGKFKLAIATTFIEIIRAVN